jgi:hypothetical protein
VPPFVQADFAKVRTLLSLGRRGPDECAIAFSLLSRLLAHAEQLQQQRTAQRTAIRALVVEDDDRLYPSAQRSTDGPNDARPRACGAWRAAGGAAERGLSYSPRARAPMVYSSIHAFAPSNELCAQCEAQ